MDPVIESLLMSIAPILTKNTAAVIADRVKAAKAKSDKEQSIQELSDLINELISENADLRTATQAFQQQLVSQQITSGDIQYVNETVIPLIEKLNGVSEIPMQSEYLNTFKELLSPNMLSVLQLLGFDFKEAIGKPLTELVRGLILSNLRKATIQTDFINLENNRLSISKDPEAYERYMHLSGK